MADSQRDPQEVLNTALCCASDECAIAEYEERAARQWLADRDTELAALRTERDTLRAVLTFARGRRTVGCGCGCNLEAWTDEEDAVIAAALAATPAPDGRRDAGGGATDDGS